jgi:putative transposase
LIFWDGASYHKYGEMRDYLARLIKRREKSEWLIICELFAPKALNKTLYKIFGFKAKFFEKTLVSL